MPDAQKAPRLQTVDALRGLVMILMVLDHVRDFVHSGAMSFQPEDLTRTTTALFFTRWVTHFCAPAFMFTAGLGAYLSLRKGRTLPELSQFLWTRGMWLVFLDVTVVRFVFSFSMTSGPVILNVLWALGWSMVALSLLVHVPMRVLAVLSIAVIALHNLLDPIVAAQFGSAGWAWNIVHQLGAFQLFGIVFVTAYPLVPWIFVMSAGFCFGKIFDFERGRRIRYMIQIGVACVALFLILRGLNIYGDPVPWSDKVPGMMLLSFLRCAKYPPSLDFLLMTLGPAILVLAGLERFTFKLHNPLLVFGRVPLFFFLLHLYVIHLLTFPMAYFKYGGVSFLLNILPSMGGDRKLYPPNYGYSLSVVYLVWLLVVVLLYPLCLWFSRLKQRRHDWWLGYL